MAAMLMEPIDWLQVDSLLNQKESPQIALESLAGPARGGSERRTLSRAGAADLGGTTAPTSLGPLDGSDSGLVVVGATGVTVGSLRGKGGVLGWAPPLQKPASKPATIQVS